MPAATPAPARPALLVADQWRDYALLDCGDGLKQERWGEYTLVRPDPQILWPRHGRERGFFRRRRSIPRGSSRRWRTRTP